MDYSNFYVDKTEPLALIAFIWFESRLPASLSKTILTKQMNVEIVIGVGGRGM